MSEIKHIYTDDGYITVTIEAGRIWLQMEKPAEPDYCALGFSLDKALAVMAAIGYAVVSAAEGDDE